MTAGTKVAFITGITGQDGSYLAELLLRKGYEVHGLVRRSSSYNTGRLFEMQGRSHDGSQENVTAPSEGRMHLHYGDMTDGTCLLRLLIQIKPAEVYNLAAQSHVGVSFDMPMYTADVDANGTLSLLTAIRSAGLSSTCRFYQASTSELYGKVQEIPQTEKTPFYPRSPYAVAKQFAYWSVVNHREAYGMFACNGILFNHESPRRGQNFVTRKITQAVARILVGTQKVLELGNLDSLRDWGHARDYVEGMWRMLQGDEAVDFVLATGEQHSVREFVELSFRRAGVEIEWSGEGASTTAVRADTGDLVVRVNPKFFRPAEVDTLLGDASLAKEKLGWVPETSFMQLVNEMVDSDLVNASDEKLTGVPFTH